MTSQNKLKKGDGLSPQPGETALGWIARVHNESDGPAARLGAFREGVRFALAALGIEYRYYSTIKSIAIIG